VEQGRQERPVGRTEADPVTLAVQLPFQNCDLMTKSEELRVLRPVAHRQQPQQPQPVGHDEVGQSKQHSIASSPIGGRQGSPPAPRSVHRP